MKRTFIKTALYVAFICIAVTVCSFGAHAAEYESFIRIDRDDPKAYDRVLENLRIITGDLYALKALSEKYGIPKDYIPAETGLDTLDVSPPARSSTTGSFTIWRSVSAKSPEGKRSSFSTFAVKVTRF